MAAGQTQSMDQGDGERGFVLLAVLVAMTVLGIMATVSLALTGAERSAANGVREGEKAFSAAEAGLEYLMATWELIQFDTLMPNPGDSIDLGWKVLANASSQRVKVRRVDAGSGPSLFYARSTGHSAGNHSGTSELGLMIRQGSGDWPSGAMAFGGNVTVNVQPTFTGECGTLQSTGTISGAAPNPLDQGYYPDSDEAAYPQAPQTTGGDSISIPEMDPLDYCPKDADYIIRDDWVVTVGSPSDSVRADGSAAAQGWRFNSAKNEYELSSAGSPAPGTVCVFGNANLSGGVGRDGAPINMSLITTGSAKVTETSFMNADHPDGITILAGGDLELSGNGRIASDNFDGLLYAGSQCSLNGELFIKGQMICRDEPNPPGSNNLDPFRNEVSGLIHLESSCDAPWMDSGPRRIMGTWTSVFE